MADTKDTATRELTEPQKAWVAALRSGKYKQGRDALTQHGRDEQGERHCCLGVACELAVKAGIVDREITDDGEIAYDESAMYLPDSVQQWLGMRTYKGELPEFTSLAAKNDSGKSFAEIADLIEKHADTLFVEASS